MGAGGTHGSRLFVRYSFSAQELKDLDEATKALASRDSCASGQTLKLYFVPSTDKELRRTTERVFTSSDLGCCYWGNRMAW